jgi:SGNH domain (fused to AT3 domains)
VRKASNTIVAQTAAARTLEPIANSQCPGARESCTQHLRQWIEGRIPQTSKRMDDNYINLHRNGRDVRYLWFTSYGYQDCTVVICLTVTGHGCTPTGRSQFSQVNGRCAQLLEYAISFVKERKPDLVILAGWWNNDLGTLASYIKRLKAEGRKVVLVGPSLHYTADVPRIIARRKSDDGFQRYTDAFVEREEVALSDSMRKFAQANQVSFIDRIHYFCENGCRVIGSDGQLLFIDGFHLSVPGATFLGNRLLRDNALQKILDSPLPLQLPEDGHER